MRAIKSWFVCHRPNCIRTIEFLSFLAALNARPEHLAVQISQIGPVHTYCWVHAHSFSIPAPAQSTVNHTWPAFWPGTHLNTGGFVVFYRYAVHRGSVSQSTVFPHSDTRNVWFLQEWAVNHTHTFLTLPVFKKTATADCLKDLCVLACLWTDKTFKQLVIPKC